MTNGNDFGPPPTIGDDEFTLRNLIGQTLIDSSDGFRGVLQPITSRASGEIIGFTLDAGGTPRRSRRVTTGMQLVTGTGELFSLASDASNVASVILPGRLLTSDERQNFGLSFAGPGAGGAGGAGGRVEFPSERALREAQTAEIIRGPEEAELARKENLRLTQLREFGSLARTFEDVKARARELIATLFGRDPFRGAVMAQGRVPRGISPFQSFMGELGQVAAAPTPQIGPTADLGQIEAGIQQAQAQQQLPTPPPIVGGALGLAEGGVIEMRRGQDGGFEATQGGAGQGVLLGEAGPEVLHFKPGGGMEVIPLVHHGQGGLGEDQLTELSIRQSLAPLFERLGFTDIPSVRRQAGTREIFGTGWPGAETFTRLGTKPRLVRDVLTSNVFMIENGQHRLVEPEEFQAAGFQRRDIVNLSHEDVLRLAPSRGPDVGMDLPVTEGGPQAFPPRAGPIVLPEELGGLLLMAPRLIANAFRFLDPQSRELYFSALGLSEFDPRAAEAELAAFTPSGTASTRVALR